MAEKKNFKIEPEINFECPSDEESDFNPMDMLQVEHGKYFFYMKLFSARIFFLEKYFITNNSLLHNKFVFSSEFGAGR